ncbi:MAG: hypothetical protein KDI02_09340 [Anaerolineae bacterium]|nr:hypothetical protein [Anaerolineae bacterium]MCB9101113.1 hypothetical protein [Anaerolineales bacterium]
MENSLTNKTNTFPNLWGLILLVSLVVVLISLAVWMIISQFGPGSGWEQNRQALAQAAFEEETGIRIIRVAMTAGGGMIDLQYQVVDPDKALIVHDDEYPPALIEESTGWLFATPFHDHAFRKLHTAVTYHELITNGDGLLNRDSTVTLTVGEARLEHVRVQ